MRRNDVWLGCLLVVAAALLSGCPARSPSLPEGYLLPQKQPREADVSRRVLLVADNQLHNVYGEPVPILRTELADKIVQTAIRPVQLDFYGQDMLAWLVQDQGARLPVVHVGDACDFSCTGEFKRFWTIMRQAQHGWVMAPGNHDGFFFGNEQRDVSQGDWPAACQNAGEPMTKDLFIRLYLAALTLQKEPSHQALARHLGLQPEQLHDADLDRIAAVLPLQGQWQYDKPEAERAFLRAVAWHINTAQPWKSFIVQEVDLTHDKAVPVSIILLDTSQYALPPALIPAFGLNAGITGEFLADQLDTVHAWIAARTSPAHVWVLLGHHPFGSFSKPAQDDFEALRKRDKVLLYVSAHTHAGQFIVHGQDNGQDTWLELNVGSILDWSLEFRTLQFYRARADGRLTLRSPRYTMHDQLREFEDVPANDAEWEAKPNDADYYLRHEDLKTLDATKTEDRLKNVLLAVHHRLLRLNPTRTDAVPDAVWPSCCKSDAAVLAEIERVRELSAEQLPEKTTLLVALDRFERERSVVDPTKHRKFRLSQAIWASKYDAVHARKPLVDNLFVVFP